MMNIKKVLVAYDGSETSKKAIMKAKEVAVQNEQIEVTIISVWELPTLVYEDYIDIDFNEKYQKQAEAEMEEAKQMIQDLPNNKQFSVLKGHIASTILDYAKKQEVDLIVIGSRGLGGVQRFFLGSVSFHVVQKAHCDVLVVK